MGKVIQYEQNPLINVDELSYALQWGIGKENTLGGNATSYVRSFSQYPDCAVVLFWCFIIFENGVEVEALITDKVDDRKLERWVNLEIVSDALENLHWHWLCGVNVWLRQAANGILYLSK